MVASDFSTTKAEQDEVDMGLQKEYQKFMGMLGWAVRTKVTDAYMYSFLSQFNTRPSLRLLNVVKRCLLFLAGQKGGPGVNLHGIDVYELLLILWTDASFDRIRYKSRAGYALQLGVKSMQVSDKKDWSNIFEGARVVDL